ncbi:MAG: hypothetical protein ACR2HN_01145 [Tepidiformaceae bacterium]
MTAKSDAIAELDASQKKFRGKLDALPEAAYGEPWLGEWDLTQLLAHMSGWFGEMTGGIERVGRGERPTPEGVDYTNADSWNAKFVQNARAGKASLTDWDAAYARYRAAAQALGEDKFGVDPEKGRPLIGNRLLQGAGIGHFAEHQEQLDAWLATRK